MHVHEHVRVHVQVQYYGDVREYLQALAICFVQYLLQQFVMELFL